MLIKNNRVESDYFFVIMFDGFYVFDIKLEGLYLLKISK